MHYDKNNVNSIEISSSSKTIIEGRLFNSNVTLRPGMFCSFLGFLINDPRSLASYAAGQGSPYLGDVVDWPLIVLEDYAVGGTPDKSIGEGSRVRMKRLMPGDKFWGVVSFNSGGIIAGAYIKHDNHLWPAENTPVWDGGSGITYDIQGTGMLEGSLVADYPDYWGIALSTAGPGEFIAVMVGNKCSN